MIDILELELYEFITNFIIIKNEDVYLYFLKCGVNITIEMEMVLWVPYKSLNRGIVFSLIGHMLLVC